MHVHCAKLLIVSCVLAGCVGIVEPTGPEDHGSTGPVPIVCNADAKRAPTVMARLTRDQYENTIRSVLAETLGASDTSAVWPRIAPAIANLPTDIRGDYRTPYAQMEQSVSPTHVRAFYELGIAVADAITDDAARETRLLGCSGARDAACIEAFIERFGRLAYRRPLEAEDVTFLRAVYDDSIDEDATRNLVAVILNAPELTYQVELGKHRSGDEVELSDEEIANRLAYLLWDAPPDESVRELVARGLSSDESYAALVDSMLADPQTNALLTRLATEWLTPLHYARLDGLNTLPDYAAYVGPTLPDGTLHTRMMAEVADSFAYHAREGDSVAGWLASPYAFARTADLAAIYRVTPWNGVSEPPRFTEPERSGLLTRAAMLASPGTSTHPIRKGVTLRRQLLCQDVPPPPDPNAVNMPVNRTGGLTTRAGTARLTEQRGTSCASCHATLINPLGFATENFDMLGRLRTEEALFDDSGRRTGTSTVERDPVVPRIRSTSTETAVDAHDVTALIAASGAVEDCLARQLVRYAMARTESTGDGCAMEAVRDDLIEGKSVIEALRTYLQRDELRIRITAGGTR